MKHTTYGVPITGGVLKLGPDPVLMGILNTTPDSFSDGGDFIDPQTAATRAHLMARAGADLIDIGGESTRPGSEPVSVQTELDRVMPVLDALAQSGIDTPISIDTYKALVADQAIQAGAAIINDVSGFRRDPEILDVAAHHDVPVIAMHWDQERDRSKDLVEEVKRWLSVSLEMAIKAGLARGKIILDPGFGFAKTLEENYQLLHRFDELHTLGCPLLVGTSRKSMIGKLLDVEPKARVSGTVATSVIAYFKGGHIFRVHDVTENHDALRVARATFYGPPRPVE